MSHAEALRVALLGVDIEQNRGLLLLLDRPGLLLFREAALILREMLDAEEKEE